MRVLMLTYPLTAVTAAACGGTEQMVRLLLRAWERQAEFRVTWIGAAGSERLPGLDFISWDQVLGRRVGPEGGDGRIAAGQLGHLFSELDAALDRFLTASDWDLIHNQGALFTGPHGAAAPVLFTLHLPRELYPPGLFQERSPRLHFQCVSRSQWRLYGAEATCGYIPNGIDLEQYPPRAVAPGRDAPLLFLGRMCPEKAPHAAIEVARACRRRLWLAGTVAPFPAHQEYFAHAIAPHLDGGIRWLPSPTVEQKRALLAEAAAVLIPSGIEETSSIVAMEAAASGVAVVATRRGALPEIVADGETGWLGNREEFPGFLDRLNAITPQSCRARAEHLFSRERMAAAYAALYRELGSGAPLEWTHGRCAGRDPDRVGAGQESVEPGRGGAGDG
ncbi:MAG: glycosyltransferase [Terriglobales bacterium]